MTREPEVIDEIEAMIVEALRTEGVYPGEKTTIDLADYDSAPFRTVVDGLYCDLIHFERRGGMTILGYTKPRLECTYLCYRS